MILFNHVCFFENAIIHKMVTLWFWNFKRIFSECTFHFKHVSSCFNIYRLTFGDKRVSAAGLHICNQLPETLKAKLSCQTFERLLSDWFGSKCKYDISSYLDNHY